MPAKESRSTLPPQHQDRQPGRESEMFPPPASRAEHYVGSGRLLGQVALVTGQGIRVNAVAPGPIWTPLIHPNGGHIVNG